MNKTTVHSTKKKKWLVLSIILALVLSIGYLWGLPCIYETAMQQKAAGNFEKAIEMFHCIHFYSDCDEQIDDCEDGILNRMYQQACILMDNGSHEEAIDAFEELDGYRDSTIMIETCQTAISDANYNTALVFIEKGRYQDAYKLLKKLGNYKDSEDLVATCSDRIQEIDYNEAISLANKGRYEDAIAAFSALHNYKDSFDQIVACGNAILESDYQEALNLYNAEKFKEAMVAFEALNEYKDSQNMVEACIEHIPAVIPETSSFTSSVGQKIMLVCDVRGGLALDDLIIESTDDASTKDIIEYPTGSGSTASITIATGNYDYVIQILEKHLEDNKLTILMEGGIDTGESVITIKNKTGDVYAECTVSNSGLTESQKANCKKVQHMSDAGFLFYEDWQEYVLHFSLKEASKERIKASCFVDVRIVNDNGLTVYEAPHYLGEDDFYYWDNAYYRDRLMAGLRINPDSIVGGDIETGTVYYTVHLAMAGSFDEQALHVENLPLRDVAQDCSLEIPDLPMLLDNNGVVSISIDDIYYSFTNNEQCGVDLVIQFIGNKLYDKNGDQYSSVGRIGYKIFDPEGFVFQSGYVSTPSIAESDRFRSVNLAFDYLVPGAYRLVLTDTNE